MTAWLVKGSLQLLLMLLRNYYAMPCRTRGHKGATTSTCGCLAVGLKLLQLVLQLLPALCKGSQLGLLGCCVHNLR